MTVSRERMLEYVYGELAGDELAAFESQLAASEADRRELTALQAALRETRALLASEPPPPARVRANVLAAAQAQLKAAASQPAGAEVAQLRLRRWLRATWIVPSLAVAAATLLMIHQRSPEQLAREVAAKSQTVEPESPPAAAPSLPVPQPEAAEADRSSAPARETQPAAKAGRADESVRERRSAASSVGAARGGAPRGAAPAQDAFAKPPPGWSADAPVPAQALGAQAEPDRLAPAPAKARVPQVSRQEEPALRATKAKRSAVADELDGLGAAEASPPTAAGVTSERAELSLAELERRAREHAALRRVPLAVADYRELLRRYPLHARASSWRRELARLTRLQGDAAVVVPVAR